MMNPTVHLKPRTELNSSLPLRLGSWMAVFFWAASVFWLSSMSGARIEDLNVVRLWDKAAHFLAFAGGSFFLCLALRFNTGWSGKRAFLAAVAAISCFGATDEWHQMFTARRSGADLGDWTADTLGAIAGAAVATLVYVRTQRKNSPAPRGD
jgi:VanZ family protein